MDRVAPVNGMKLISTPSGGKGCCKNRVLVRDASDKKIVQTFVPRRSIMLVRTYLKTTYVIESFLSNKRVSIINICGAEVSLSMEKRETQPRKFIAAA